VYHSLMPLLLALYLLITQAFAAAPSATATLGGARVRERTPVAATALRRIETARDDSVRPDAAPHRTSVWVRDARPIVPVFATRVDGTPSRTPLAGAAAGRLSMEAAFAASVRVRTLDESHEVSGRGALLPYFPTAPPLQG
jgi:hypothetical protein